MAERVSAVILAAGNGKRMKSARPKALCEVLFKPMVCWVRDWCRKAGIEDLCVVLPPDDDQMKKLFPEGTAFVVQQERKGTGDAARRAAGFIAEHPGDVLIMNADAPFIDDEAINGALRLHRQDRAAVTVITARVENPFGYGRIVRQDRSVAAIVEQADADDAVKAIDEINSGAYWFQTDFLLGALERLDQGNAQSEYYLTDTVRQAVRNRQRARAWLSPNRDIALGANTRQELLRLNEIARRKVLNQLMDDGVSVLCMDGLLVSPDASVGQDTTLYPGVVIKGSSRIGRNCVITSGSVIDDSEIGDGVTINASQITRSTVADGTRIGPFTQLRPDSHIGKNVKIGDFVEVKNSTIGDATSVAHLTYVGDSDVGERVNFGCGVVTVNYNGKSKSRTVIGNDAFIGCNTNLVAPVKVGDRAYTAAGSTITEDVPEGALAIARERQTVKSGWADGYRPKPQAGKEK